MVKNLLANAGNGTPLQYSCLGNPMGGGAWWAAVHGVVKSRARLSDFTFTFMHWRRKWQPTPALLPGESQGRGSLWADISGVAQSRTRLKRLSSSSRTGAYRPMDGPRSRQGNADLQQGSHQRVITGTAAARVCSCREPQLRVASTGDPLMLP